MPQQVGRDPPAENRFENATPQRHREERTPVLSSDATELRTELPSLRRALRRRMAADLSKRLLDVSKLCHSCRAQHEVEVHPVVEGFVEIANSVKELTAVERRRLHD